MEAQSTLAKSPVQSGYQGAFAADAKMQKQVAADLSTVVMSLKMRQE